MNNFLLNIVSILMRIKVIYDVEETEDDNNEINFHNSDVNVM